MSEQAYAVVGYIRVSTSEQADSGAGLEAQRAAITSEAERRGWELLHVFEDAGASGKSMNGRQGSSGARGRRARGGRGTGRRRSSTVSRVRSSTSRRSWSGRASAAGT